MSMPATIDPPRSTTRGESISSRIVADAARFALLETDWESIGPSLPSPMESFGWALAAAASLKQIQRPSFVVAEQEGSVRAIAQLAQVRDWSWGRLEIVGMNRLNEPADFAFADHAALAVVVRRAIRLHRPILLGRLPAESPTIAMFEQFARGRGLVLVRPRASCPYIPLDESWLEPESHLNSNRRSDYRRACRRAEQQGSVQAEILTPRPSEVEGLLDLAFAVEARSWKGTAGTALAGDPIRGQFIREFADWASRAGTLRIGLLRIGETYAAMQIAAEQNQALWLLKIGFDPAFAKCSPGNLLLAEALRYAAAQGLSSLEFLGTVEPWTQVWTDHERKCVSLRYYPFNPRGAMALIAEGAGTFIRRFRAKTTEQPAAEKVDQDK